MADGTTSERKTYRRDDGALMVEVRPGQFVNEELAANWGLINASAVPTKGKAPSSPQRPQRAAKAP